MFGLRSRRNVQRKHGKLFGGRNGLQNGRSAFEKRLRLEPLEDRRLLTVYTVDSLLDTVADDGLVTLREAIQAANTNTAVYDAAAGSSAETDVIQFDPSLFTSGSATIMLSGTALTISDSLQIEGPGAASLTINGGGNSRIFTIRRRNHCEHRRRDQRSDVDRRQRQRRRR